MPTPAPLAWIATLPDRLRLLAPVLRLSRPYLAGGDPWRSTDHPVPLWMFGEGCVQDFDWYLEGDSQVSVGDLGGLCYWLAGCEYVSDAALFRTDDFWQHPSTFEQIRKGDCDDHALWDWRKLARLGYDSEFMVGECIWPDGTSGQHAWVVFGDGRERFLLEGTGGDPHDMVRPLDAARSRYRPHLGVDHRLARKIYLGLLQKMDRNPPVADARRPGPVGP